MPVVSERRQGLESHRMKHVPLCTHPMPSQGWLKDEDSDYRNKDLFPVEERSDMDHEMIYGE